jgi:hypothetical protein
MTLRAHVFESLDNARANGYDPREQSIEWNVLDLMRCDYVCERHTDDELRPHVRAWLEANGGEVS